MLASGHKPNYYQLLPSIFSMQQQRSFSTTMTILQARKWSTACFLVAAFSPRASSAFVISVHSGDDRSVAPVLVQAAAPSSGGFGKGGGGGGFSAKSKPDKRAKGKNSKRPSILSEVQIQNKNSDNQNGNGATGPILDKWGLPPPTEDDIFPPMPPGTELIPVNNEKEDITLSDIQDALRDHIQLKALETRFNHDCTEKQPKAGRDPMKLHLLHRSPPILAIDNFFTTEECEHVKTIALEAEEQNSQRQINPNKKTPVQVQSATFSALSQSKRTSTSWFCYYSQVPTLLAKALHVVGIPTLDQMEEPQIVRYKTGEVFSWHYDEVPINQLKNGGQRLATLLVYLNDVGTGGGTVFRDLQDGSTDEMLAIKPKLGRAALFFPAFQDGKHDERTLHKGEIAHDEKWIIQMWIHQKQYVATLPEGNFQQSAREGVDQISSLLGY